MHAILVQMELLFVFAFCIVLSASTYSPSLTPNFRACCRHRLQPHARPYRPLRPLLDVTIDPLPSMRSVSSNGSGNWEIAQMLLDAKADATAQQRSSEDSRMVCKSGMSSYITQGGAKCVGGQTLSSTQDFCSGMRSSTTQPQH